VFPVRYELNLYINFLRNSVFEGLIYTGLIQSGACPCQHEITAAYTQIIPEFQTSIMT
jgi:hypothetical protein